MAVIDTENARTELPEQALPPWRRAVLKVGSNLLAADGGDDFRVRIELDAGRTGRHGRQREILIHGVVLDRELERAGRRVHLQVDRHAE